MSPLKKPLINVLFSLVGTKARLLNGSDFDFFRCPIGRPWQAPWSVNSINQLKDIVEETQGSGRHRGSPLDLYPSTWRWASLDDGLAATTRWRGARR